MKKITILLLFVLCSVGVSAQVVHGTVTDAEGNTIIGATVREAGTMNGAVTDIDGKYHFTVSKLPTTIIVSSVGFQTMEQVITSVDGALGFQIKEDVSALEGVVVTGTRGRPRTILDSAVPIDNFNVEELAATGKTQIDQMLNYKVPSFNSQNQAISDATAHYDPADLRGLGPSRTLVLVNGKRKNQSAQVYLNRTPGKGEVGVDLKSIPSAAIDRIEVLRDGASSQYGSDAIAGVINIILKQERTSNTLGIRSGVTTEGDGFNFAADYNGTKNIGKGWINYTLGYFKQEKTNRAGIVGAGDQGPAPVRSSFDTDDAFNAASFIWNRNEAWLRNNPRAGMIVGQPDIDKKEGMINMAHPIGENSEFYTFHSVTSRDGRSFAYYRAPYWRPDVRAAEHFTTNENFIGYHPTFEVDILDNMSSAGVRWKMGKLHADASATYGSNKVDYTVNRSVNRDYLADHGWSPRTFNPGGYTFSNLIGNVDFNTLLGDGEDVFLGFGFEAKKDNFSSREGDPLSYYKGGSDSFAGIKPQEVVDESRNNKAAYALVDYDVNEDLLIGAAARFEDYSDFGSNFSYKVNGRYKFAADGVLRASYSTGFRAPTLHQRYLINSQYIIVQGSPDPQLQGTLANNNPAVVALGVPNLKAETSKNLTAGATYRFNEKASISADFYNIKVNDRVLFSSQIQALSPGDAVDMILQQNNVRAVQFFINAGNTNTTGADIVLNFNHLNAGNGLIDINLASNFNKTEIESIDTPQQLEQGGYNIFERREQFLITDSRPKYKFIAGLGYENGRWRLGLDNTLFGPVTVAAAGASASDFEHSPQLVTDFRLGFDVSNLIGLTANLNNVFNQYPDDIGNTTGEDANGRFDYSSIVQQQNFLGTNFLVGANLRFNRFSAE